MKIALAGSTGFIGKQLSDYLLRSGNELIVISRSDFNKGSNHMAKVIISADVIINLAGAPVLRRWTEKNKKLILDSRINTTRLLVEAVQMNHPEHSPKIFINASAIGIYDNVGIHNEFSAALGSDFLAEVCKAWESEIIGLKEINVRWCTIRIGIVLGAAGGSLGKMLPIFNAGLGGRIGSGKQPFSFIHISDFCRAIEHLIGNNSSGGVYNLVSPNPSSNYLFTKVLSRFLRRPAFFTIPEFALKLIYGEAAEILTEGAYVVPQRLLNEGFQFQFSDISSALTDLVKEKVMMNKDAQGEIIPPIYIVSGGKGLAGDAVVKSVLIQFPNNTVPVIIVPDILSQEKTNEIISKALITKGVIVHTMVDPEARKMLIDSCVQSGVTHFDLVGDLSDYLSNLLNTQPISKPGLYRLSHIAYFQRVEAIDFTLKVDDGQNPERIAQADIVLTGVSRTGKTPLSVYLAMFGWKVANVPIVPGIEPPEELFKADPGRVFGLNISPAYLIAQRANRVKSLKMDQDTDYINARKVGEELALARRIFERGGFTEIQITNKPIESSANEILNILTSRFVQEKWKKEGEQLE